ncbi:glycosyltransferase [Desulfitobacterium dichloroeliminans LMG P-21439]|uniref:Glycosyltransferase n=1 Tax=Desulfitobacterium dichloroeliminans (strain LMG P-21439 / DCA1) TaxID=871963 RepID=L0F4P0_DESDL|nr:glycosyltransferase [Desulfitobacterium dichloroeliminans]AGA68142.1 glycosyltransferase [Desulfitobacterium dichloroeliminans LMG P-21439]
MKVLFQVRQDYRKHPAGDTIQLLATAQALKNLGVQVFLNLNPKVQLEEYDLVHIFNVTPVVDVSMFFENAKKQNKPLVVSPSYWNMESYLKNDNARSPAFEQWESYQPWRGQLLRECDLLLPSGHSEMEHIQKDFQVTTSYQVIPNGFPTEYLGIDETCFREQCPGLPEEFVLSVGRISSRKNQKWLAQCCQELGLTLVLAGPIDEPQYFEEVQAYPHVIYLGTLQGRLLASAYAAAKVHAMPSWYETTGLSSLEAGACGARVLTTNQGWSREYFQDMAVYVNPFEEDSLIPALEKALTISPKPLTEHIHKHYSWARVGELTLAAYRHLLES